MPVKPIVLPVVSALAPLADAQRALEMGAYMRGKFEFLGIQTPARRRATTPLLREARPHGEVLELVSALWALPHREFQYVAVDLLDQQSTLLGLDDVAFMLELAQQRSWWDSVDGLAGVIGDVVRRSRATVSRAQGCMDKASRHPNLWVRRIALLHQLGWRSDVDRKRLFGYCTRLADDEDFFIRKAIGWALRDFAKFDADAVREYLAGDGKALSALSVREASKHL